MNLIQRNCNLIAKGFFCLILTACGNSTKVVTKSDKDIFVPVYDVNQIVRINSNTYEIVEIIKVGKSPHDLVFSPDKKLIYVVQKTGMDNNTVFVMEVGTGKKIAEIPVGQISHHLAISPVGNQLYVATGNFVVVDTKSKQIIKSFEAEKVVCVTANEKVVFWNDFGASSIYCLNPVNNTITDTLKPTGHPLHNVLSPDGKRLYVTVWSSESNHSGVAIYDTETNENLGFVKTGTDAADLDVSPDGKTVYVTNTNKGIVYRFNSQTFELEWQVNIPSARAITVNADGKKLFVGPMGHNTLYVLGTSNGKLLHKIEMQGQPNHVRVIK